MIGFVVAIFCSVIVFLGFTLFEVAVLDLRPFLDRAPIFTPYYVLRMAVSLGLSFWIVIKLPLTARLGEPQTHSPDLRLHFPIWLTTTIAMLICADLFLISPQSFSYFAREDRLVEWASAFFLFASSGASAFAFFRLRNSGAHQAPKIMLIAFAAFLFVAGMEEISWMQRIFNVETPTVFDANRQNELNLHNFATTLTENLFYLGSFLFLILLPFLRASLQSLVPRDLFSILPTHLVAIAAAPMVALNWDMWNIIPIQMVFWVTVLSFGKEAWQRHSQNDGHWMLFGAMAACLIVLHNVFLILGDALVREWDTTEYKELFIAYGLAVYCLLLLRATRTPAKPSS